MLLGSLTPKNLAPANGDFTGFDPTPNRRTYTFSNGSFGSPNFIDNPGWSWGGNPVATHYKVQMRYAMDGFESINAPQSTQDHAYALAINGVEMFVVLNNPNSSITDTGWFDIPNTASGGITFHDWAAGQGAGGSARVGTVTLYWQYVWIG